MTSYQFWVNLHAEPLAPLARGQLELGSQALETLIIPPGLAGTPFAVSFEEAYVALDRLEQMLIEPDGSFVWRSSQGQSKTHWQVDGVLYDRADKLAYVELKGHCPAAQFDQLLSAFGWPGTRLIFQLVREAAFLDEPNFRRHASACSDPTGAVATDRRPEPGA